MAKRLRRIEELPDEILVDILSRLNNTKEAVRICTASRGWRNLWKLCWNLDLDFTNKKYAVNDVRRCVDYVLNNHRQGVNLDRLIIAFHYPDECSCVYNLDLSFQDWFEFANGKRAETLNINLGDLKFGNMPPSQWVPPKIAMTLNSWERLTTLCLKSVIFDDADFDLLLLKSPNLKTLLLENVPLTKLAIKNTNPKLKLLEIHQCWAFKCIHIVSVPNLESFIYAPPLELPPCACDFKFQHAPKLEAINLGGQYCRNLMLKLQEYVPQLQKLQMYMDIYGCKNCSLFDISVPTLKNLKDLELKFTCTRRDDEDFDMMDTVINIINSCPSLEKLTLKYEIKNYEHEEFNDVDYGYQPDFYECLKNVEVVGWSGFNSEVRFMRYLIHTSHNLQDLTLDPTPPHQTETEWYSHHSPMPKMKCEFEHAAQTTQQLTDYLRKIQRARTLEGET